MQTNNKLRKSLPLPAERVHLPNGTGTTPHLDTLQKLPECIGITVVKSDQPVHYLRLSRPILSHQDVVQFPECFEHHACPTNPHAFRFFISSPDQHCASLHRVEALGPTGVGSLVGFPTPNSESNKPNHYTADETPHAESY